MHWIWNTGEATSLFCCHTCIHISEGRIYVPFSARKAFPVHLCIKRQKPYPVYSSCSTGSQEALRKVKWKKLDKRNSLNNYFSHVGTGYFLLFFKCHIAGIFLKLPPETLFCFVDLFLVGFSFLRCTWGSLYLKLMLKESQAIAFVLEYWKEKMVFGTNCFLTQNKLTL